jgi:hypothetical protein
MSIPKKTYRYRVEYTKRGQWIPVLQTDHEDAVTFGFVANANERQYRILCDGADVTESYRNHPAELAS